MSDANSEAHIEEHSSTNLHIHEELIFRNKDTHLKTRSAFIDEHSMLGLFLMIEPTFVDEYLKGTTNLGLLYTESQDYKLVRFFDADYVEDRIERKSISGNCQFLGENLISSASERQ
ncbi:hypothetical protein MTR_8g040540 [Medicago truncatula]|uniref:Uncharacterized protein n=1 Tax=Medicago truncatula TaxID=3880 RepID=G7LHL0_MEDTR|nr:hypothetical protein MTR_8g040540 [Medicago truncatula]